MGRWQKVMLKLKKAETTTSSSGTVTLDLPEKDYISQLTIIPYNTNPSITTPHPLLPQFLAIKKIEVLNGSEVIKSLSGSQVQALAYYWGRTNPSPHRLDWEATETYDYFFLRFGRYPEDMEYILNMADLVNPQLKITYDFDTVIHDGVTYETKPTYPYFKWSVLADMYRGALPVPRKGFIRSQQIEDWILSTGTTTKYVDIPRTELICGLMLQGGAYEIIDSVKHPKRLLQAFNRIRLNLNTGHEIPIDIYEEEIMALQEEWFQPPPHVDARIETYQELPFDSGLGLVEALSYVSRMHAPAAEYQVEGKLGGYLRMSAYDFTGSKDETKKHALLYKINGLFPHHTVYLPMEKVTADGAFTLDAPSYAKILLELTSASADTSIPKNCVLETVGP